MAILSDIIFSQKVGAFSPPEFIAACSTKCFGNMAFSRDRDGSAPHNFRRFVRELGVSLDQTAVAVASTSDGPHIAILRDQIPAGRQVITPQSRLVERLVCAQRDFGPQIDTPARLNSVDSIIAPNGASLLGILPADCGVIGLYDPTTRASAIVHNGWVGCFRMILTETVELMRQDLGVRPSNLFAYIFPCAKYPNARLADSFLSDVLQKQAPAIATAEFDASKFALKQLLDCGVSLDRIETSPICTLEQADRFYSYQRSKLAHTEQAEGRQMCLWGLSVPQGVHPAGKSTKDPAADFESPLVV